MGKRSDNKGVPKSLFLGAALLFMSIFPSAAQSITFAVDLVEPADRSVGYSQNGTSLAEHLHQEKTELFISEWRPEILANSFSEEKNIFNIGEDVLFQMLLTAWRQHRPVVLTPDAVWMVISQGFSYYVNKHPEEMSSLLVNHEGKKELRIRTYDELFSSQADWQSLIAQFTAEIDKYTVNDIATTLVADFSTTGINERIASEVTLMDVVKPYFNYTVIYGICGIPSITLTGTPEDWRKVKQKTLALNAFGLDWWVNDLEPILDEFIKASEGKPDISFWKDIVKKTRPQTIQGPTCGKRQPKLTQFDGWFLKLFPFDNDGKTPETVIITQTMLPETVCVPVKYEILALDGTLISSFNLEIVAGIVGVCENPENFTLTPKIGWFVRTTKPQEVIEREKAYEDSLNRLISIDDSIFVSIGHDPFSWKWNEKPLSWDDFLGEESESELFRLKCFLRHDGTTCRYGNTFMSYYQYLMSMIPSESWCVSHLKNDGMLQLLQTGFDYAEISRRKAQAEAFSGEIVIETEILNDIQSFIKKMSEETDNGQDSSALRVWTDKVADELAKTENPKPPKPDIKMKGYAISSHFRLEREHQLGNKTPFVTPTTVANLGLGVIVNRLSYLIDARFKEGFVQSDYNHNGTVWTTGENIEAGDIDLSIGYSILDTDWLRMTPFAGIGVSYYDYRPQSWIDEGRKSDEIGGPRILAGLYSDIKLVRCIDLYFYNGKLTPFSMYEVTLRPFIYSAYTAIQSLPSSWSFCYGISLNIGFWSFKKKDWLFH